MNFFMPFISNYSAKLKCDQEKNFKITLNTTKFTNSSYSRLKCYNKFYETRWCEGRNIGFVEKNFTFYSKAHIDFDKPFLVPGPRAPPFDKSDERWFNEPKLVNSLPNHEIERRGNNSYIYGTFWNEQMLWHTVFDFIVPFLTFVKYHSKDSLEQRTIYVHHFGDIDFEEYIQVMGDIKILEREKDFIMERVFIGIDKFEDNPYEDREYDDSISFNYNFVRADYNGLRNTAIRLNKISKLGFGLKNKPLVFVIDRNTSKRNISNSDEYYKAIYDVLGDFYIVNGNLDRMHPKDQLYFFARCSILIGVHGSGLTNVVWMHPSTYRRRTHIVELLPLGYTCRDWFRVAADYSKVKYHSIYSSFTVDDSDLLKKCRAKAWKCAKSYCHDHLRDQSITVPIDKFRAVLEEIKEDVKDTFTFDEFGLVPYKFNQSSKSQDDEDYDYDL